MCNCLFCLLLIISFISVITNCTNKEFTCHKTDSTEIPHIRCIPRGWINDGFAQCENESDENITSVNCNNDEWACDEGTRCLPANQVGIKEISLYTVRRVAHAAHTNFVTITMIFFVLQYCILKTTTHAIDYKG